MAPASLRSVPTPLAAYTSCTCTPCVTLKPPPHTAPYLLVHALHGVKDVLGLGERLGLGLVAKDQVEDLAGRAWGCANEERR